MNDDKKKKLLAGTAVCGMLVFVTYTFFPDLYEETNYSDLANPQSMDTSPSRQQIHEEKIRKEHREFRLDRKVSNFDHFLQEEVVKEPYGSTDVEAEVFKAEKSIATAENSKMDDKAGNKKRKTGSKVSKNDSNRVVTPKDEISGADTLKKKVSRRMGFASGGLDKPKEKINKMSPELHIPTVIHEDARVASGSAIMLRTLEEFEVEGHEVPANTLLSGRVQLSGNRLYIRVNHIRVDDQIIAAELTAHDVLGIEGLVLEGGTDKELKGEAMEEAVSEIGKSVDIPLLRSIPFTAAKKKISEMEVPVVAGIKVYLRKAEG